MEDAKDLELAQLMRKVVRECSFDFELAAATIRSHYSEKHQASALQRHERKHLNITAGECRAIFAMDYNNSAPAPGAAELEEPQTFDDVLKLQRRIEEQSRLNHARVFDRVFASLGITPGKALLTARFCFLHVGYEFAVILFS